MNRVISHIGRRLAAMLIGISVAVPAMFAVELPDEDLSYAIMYKWGLINKQAGWAVLSLRNDAENYRAQLAAGTMPWADKIYFVRDTLQSVMMKQDCLPQKYVKISHEGNKYSSSILNYSRQGDEVSATVTRSWCKNDGPMEQADTVLYAPKPGLDMLSVFYYIRNFDFASMPSGQTIEVNVFSGRRVEVLTIHYGGIEKVKIDGKMVPTYAITFTFTMKGKTSDYPMYCWISTDDQHIPLKMEGQLPFGKVQAFYKGPAN
ncbi:MAG: DUF3108 domain-containing protein [Muribaculum sp.]|nr:DUF3108 domain-containing protein [Muribaculum sp.]